MNQCAFRHSFTPALTHKSATRLGDSTYYWNHICNEEFEPGALNRASAVALYSPKEASGLRPTKPRNALFVITDIWRTHVQHSKGSPQTAKSFKKTTGSSRHICLELAV
jgi:hypothetical protein